MIKTPAIKQSNRYKNKHGSLDHQHTSSGKYTLVLIIFLVANSLNISNTDKNNQIINEIDQRFYNLMKNKQKYYVYMPSKNKPIKAPIVKPNALKKSSSKKIIFVGNENSAKVPKLKNSKKMKNKSMVDISRYWI
jgi:hypothetical protein